MLQKLAEVCAAKNLHRLAANHVASRGGVLTFYITHAKAKIIISICPAHFLAEHFA